LNPQKITIEVIEQFDDICIKCNRRERDEEGSVWGKSHSCTSSRKPKTVEWTNRRNREILDKLRLRFGSVSRPADLALAVVRFLSVSAGDRSLFQSNHSPITIETLTPERCTS
jgi:hypothetical protein